jgi:hypothetical protein
MTRRTRIAFASIASALLAVLPTVAARAAVPNPTVTGPIPENAPPGDPSHDYTFFTSDLVEQFGYVEEEFFVEGTANTYSTPPLTTGSVITSRNPYKTRIVVRRPKHKLRFNGTVVLEWQNVTAGYDIDASWVGGNAEHLMRSGYVWVGVSAQRVGVHQTGTGLRNWSPVRYGTLDVTNGGTILNDALSYDIYSQAGQAIMHPVGVDPLAGLKPRRILASGASQSAGRLTTYYNSIHPLADLFDGFFLLVGGGAIRTDLGVPVFKLLSETEVTLVAAGLASLQPDSDIHRTWQVAGAAHADRTFLNNVRDNAMRDGIPTTPPGLCTRPEGSQLRFFQVTNIAHDHLVRWVRSGTPPPTAPAIEIAAGPPAAIARDELGLALGGIRLADIEVPVALNTGSNGGPSFCILFGTHIPFDEATLDALYPSHNDYVVEVFEATIHNLFAGYITPFDALVTVLDALASMVGV